jgi:protein involved in polysaccharide export with SLBB domain
VQTLEQRLQAAQGEVGAQAQELQYERDYAANALASLANETASAKNNSNEVFKLSGEVARLRRENTDLNAARSRGKVYLAGTVRLPGPQEIPGGEILTLSEAILRAGGFGDFADKSKVKVTRKSPDGGTDQVLVENVGLVLERQQAESDLALEPGDLIFVPQRVIRF